MSTGRASIGISFLSRESFPKQNIRKIGGAGRSSWICLVQPLCRSFIASPTMPYRHECPAELWSLHDERVFDTNSQKIHRFGEHLTHEPLLIQLAFKKSAAVRLEGGATQSQPAICRSNCVPTRIDRIGEPGDFRIAFGQQFPIFRYTTGESHPASLTANFSQKS